MVAPSARNQRVAGPATAVSACAPAPGIASHDMVRSTTIGSLAVTRVENAASASPASASGSIVVLVRAASVKAGSVTGVVVPATRNSTEACAGTSVGFRSATRVRMVPSVAPSAR